MQSRHKSCRICNGLGLSNLSDYTHVELVQCDRCGCVFSPKIPTQKELIEHYDGYTRDTSVSEVSEKRRAEVIAAFDDYHHHGRMLDVGCGVGQLLDMAKEYGWVTHGIEFTDTALSICESKGHEMQRGPLDSTVYAADSFDVIVYSEVIEHINNQQEEFEHVYRLLRPGGLLYVTTPNFNSISRHLLGERWNVIQYPEHLVYFTPSTLTKLMRAKGFETKRVETTGISISRLMGSLINPPNSTTHRQTKQVDESLRSWTEAGRIGPTVKSIINTLLRTTATGDSMKGWFVKPA